MLGFTVRRLLISIPILIVASFLVFLLVTASGDPLTRLKAQPGISEATIEARRHELGLDRPVMARYWDWAKGAVHGDFGESSQFHEPVTTVLIRRLGVTLRLVLIATIVAVLIGVAIGVLAAVRQYSAFDYGTTFLAFVFFSMPVFWLAAVLKDGGIRINNAVGQRIFYTVGEQTPNFVGTTMELWMNRLGHLLLPSLTLILVSVAGWSRYQRATMLDEMNADYVRTAQAKGLSRRKVITHHALRNALIPVVTIVAIDFATVLGGAILTETVFSWKGMGVLLVESLETQDTNMILGWLMVTAVLIIVFNLIADITYGYLDPRIRYG